MKNNTALAQVEHYAAAIVTHPVPHDMTEQEALQVTRYAQAVANVTGIEVEVAKVLKRHKSGTMRKVTA